jgi:hypothetical protein
MTSACVMMASTFFSGSRSATHNVEPTLVAARGERSARHLWSRRSGRGERRTWRGQRRALPAERRDREAATSYVPATRISRWYCRQWSPVAVPRDR